MNLPILRIQENLNHVIYGTHQVTDNKKIVNLSNEEYSLFYDHYSRYSFLNRPHIRQDFDNFFSKNIFNTTTNAFSKNWKQGDSEEFTKESWKSCEDFIIFDRFRIKKSKTVGLPEILEYNNGHWQIVPEMHKFQVFLKQIVLDINASHRRNRENIKSNHFSFIIDFFISIYSENFIFKYQGKNLSNEKMHHLIECTRNNFKYNFIDNDDDDGKVKIEFIKRKKMEYHAYMACCKIARIYYKLLPTDFIEYIKFINENHVSIQNANAYYNSFSKYGNEFLFWKKESWNKAYLFSQMIAYREDCLDQLDMIIRKNLFSYENLKNIVFKNKNLNKSTMRFLMNCPKILLRSVPIIGLNDRNVLGFEFLSLFGKNLKPMQMYSIYINTPYDFNYFESKKLKKQYFLAIKAMSPILLDYLKKNKVRNIHSFHKMHIPLFDEIMDFLGSNIPRFNGSESQAVKESLLSNCLLFNLSEKTTVKSLTRKSNEWHRDQLNKKLEYYNYDIKTQGLLINGISFEPIKNTDEIIDEASEMRHCIVSYHHRIVDKKYMAFRVVADNERATLGCHVFNNQLVFNQCYSKYNNAISENTYKACEIFIENINNRKDDLFENMQNNSTCQISQQKQMGQFLDDIPF